jgi:hypothetical protein
MTAQIKQISDADFEKCRCFALGLLVVGHNVFKLNAGDH